MIKVFKGSLWLLYREEPQGRTTERLLRPGREKMVASSEMVAIKINWLGSKLNIYMYILEVTPIELDGLSVGGEKGTRNAG